MIYTNKLPAVVATAVMFLAVAIAPQWTKAQSPPPMPKVDPECTLAIIDIVQNCYSTLSAIPSEECCKGLKSAGKTQVACLCDNFIAHPVYGNLSRPYYNQINTACGVLDKYVCDGTSEGEDTKGGDTKGGDAKGGDAKGGDANGGATDKIAASMGLFGLVASLFFPLF